MHERFSTEFHQLAEVFPAEMIFLFITPSIVSIEIALIFTN